MLILMLLDCIPPVLKYPFYLLAWTCFYLVFPCLIFVVVWSSYLGGFSREGRLIGGCRFRDKPDVFANQARQCAILSTSSAMLYDTPGQEDEDSGLRFGKITKEEYNDILHIARGMWERKHPESQAS